MTKILLVEDDRSLREIYGVRLLAEGYDIVSAGDGEEALAMAIKERPTLIVSDVMMPKISGFDMLDILRSTTETRDIKVIMMTALSSEDQRQRGEQLGADRYLVKSQVGIEDVVRTVHEVLGDAPTSADTEAPEAAPKAEQPAPTEAPAQPQAEAMPQPTAPFTSPRPATLGERVIQPLGDTAETSANDDNLADRIAAELNAAMGPAPEAAQPALEAAPVEQSATPTEAPQPQAVEEITIPAVEEIAEAPDVAQPQTAEDVQFVDTPGAAPAPQETPAPNPLQQ